MANSQDELNKLLLDSADDGNIDNVQHALDQGADINCSDKYRRTPIQCALEHGHLDVLKFLLNKGAKATSEDWNEFLWKSAGDGNIDNVQYALDHGADINCRSSDYVHDQMTPFQLTPIQWTPIQWALERGRLHVFKFLLSKGAKATSEDLNEFLLKSARVGNIDNVQYALDHGADINCRSSDRYHWTPIHWALVHSRLHVFKFLLSKGAKVTSEDWYKFLLKSASDGNIDNVQYALDHGAEINCRSSDGYLMIPIQCALENGHVNVIELLLGKGGKVTSEDLNEFLLKSAGDGNIDNVQYALDHGADINCRSSDEYSWTPIQWALKRGHLDVFKFLLNKGAKVTSEDL